MPNRLADETSPYLLQHRDNPVDWYPWGPEALERARAADKPILLSIGYSACHWCHVMEHESFEDAEVAALMNQDFINIKVDREERPDLDEIYMQSVQAFTGGRGGWPMTVFLAPDGRPYFGGTYFPPQPSRGMPSFRQVLAHAARAWRDDREQIAKLGGELVEHLASLGRMPNASEALSDQWLPAVARAAMRDFDPVHGGFGGAPKFPPSGTLSVLLAWHYVSGDPKALKMVRHTLDSMAKGGMYDLAGGGFARYSVDAEWRIPHFEKMLYDNGQLIPVYLDAYRVTGEAHYARIARESLDYVLREMTLEHGGFAASQDADSEGEEGKFFVWTPAELRQVLGMVDGLRAATLLQVSDTGNFEHGTSVLRLETPLESLTPEDRALLERALPMLYAHRQIRVAPGRDDKVVVAWNGLMISAMALGAQVLGEPKYLEAASRAARFCLDTATVDGRLHRTWKDGRAGPKGFLDDHANLLNGLIDLFEASGDGAWLDHAEALAQQLVARFWDEVDGGFFFTGSDAEALVTRSKSLIGGAVPSGNGVAALALTRLEALSGDAQHGERADRILRGYQPLLERAGRALGPEALAGAWRSRGGHQIAALEPALLEQVRSRYLPFAVRSPVADPRLPWVHDKPVGAAYVCEFGSCKLPSTSPDELREQLDSLVGEPLDPGAARGPAPALPTDPELWLNGPGPMSFEGLHGHVVVLDFWTHCCINCMHVLPELAAVEAHFAGRPVVVIGVHSAKFPRERTRPSIQAAIARHGIAHPVINDADHAIWKAFSISSWPTIAIVDPQGRVAHVDPGEARREDLIEKIEALLTEGATPTTAWSAQPPALDTGELAFPGKIAVFPDPQDQARGADPFDGNGRVYIADTAHHRVLECRLDKGPDGWPLLAFARAFGDGQAGLVDGAAPRFNRPQGMSSDGTRLWVADTENHAIREVSLSTGEASIVAGTGALGRGGPADPNAPTELALRSPWDLVHAEGVLFVAMAGTHQIWLYDPTRGQTGPFVGSGQESHVDGEPDEAALAQPSGMVMAGRYLFWVDSETSSVRVLDLADSKVGTVVGRGLFDWGDVDGEGEAVRLQHPLGITLVDGTLVVADTYNGKLKVIDLGESASRSLVGGLSEPGGICAAGEYALVADTGAHRIVAVHVPTGELRPVEIAGLE